MALFAFVSLSWAQDKDTLRLNVNGNEIIILTDDINNLNQTDYNAIIQKLTNETQKIIAEQKREFAEIDKQEKNGEITAEEAAELKGAVAERTSEQLDELSDNIEKWADEYGETLEENAEDYEEWADQWERNAEKYDNSDSPPTPPATETENRNKTIIINDDGITIEGEGDWEPEGYKDATEKYKSQQTYGTFDMHFGWANWISPDLGGFVTGNDAELRPWQSTTWGFGFGGKTRLGQDSRIYFRYGLEFNWYFFRLRGNTLLTKVSEPNFDGIRIAPDMDPNKNYLKSTFRVSYIDLPIMFEFDNSRPGRSNGFSFGVGGYGGVRINSSTKVHYDDFNGDGTKQVTHNNFYANAFRYGAQAQIGFGTFKITGKYDLNSLWRQDKNTPDYQIGSITFGFVFP